MFGGHHLTKTIPTAKPDGAASGRRFNFQQDPENTAKTGVCQTQLCERPGVDQNPD